MKIARKLALLPMVALAGIALIVAIVVVDIRVVFNSADVGNARVVPALQLLSTLRYNFTATRINVWQHIEAHDPAAMADIEKQMASKHSLEEEALQAYEVLAVDAKDKELLTADRGAVAAYEIAKQRILAMSRDGKKADAIAFTLTQAPVLARMGDQINEHFAYLSMLSKNASASADATERATIRTVIFLGLLTVGVVGAIGYIVFRQIMRQLGGEPDEVVAVANKVVQGDFSSAIALRPGDITSMFAAVAKMQQGLKAHIETDRAAAGENLRIRIALDRVSVGVMLADTDGKIIYTNDFGADIFRLRAGEIRKQLPQFDAERIIGASFDSFHRVPSHQRNLLAGLTGTHIADIKMGAATLRVIANPVVDAAGVRLGTVVQWIDRTAEVAVEEDVQRTVSSALAGDLTTRIQEGDKQGFFKTLAVGVNQIVSNMSDAIRSMSVVAAEVGTGAQEIAKGNIDLSSRTEEQASNLEQTAASMEQMTAAVKNNADNASQASQLALAARDQAERGGAVVQNAVSAMSEINTSSKKIAAIIGVIDEIAFQTNLLALNAAVEAARAGEQGRGFAVVASEVRNLASRSAAAAKEIKGLIQESVSKVEDGSKLVDASGAVLREIVTGVKKVTDVVAEIAASSKEQASGIDQVNKALMSMDAGTQQNAALVEQAAAAAQSLTEQAGNLGKLMAHYQVGDESSSASRSSSATSIERRDMKRPWTAATPKRVA
jgi:methyl-accepting chemotaxis protein